MPYVNVLIHAVSGTKSRQDLIRKDIRQDVFEHIKNNANEKGFYIDCINGMDDHIHLIVELHADISISKTMQLIKGESSHWINQQRLTKKKFEWADEYFAESVSPDSKDRARNYIRNQEEHHRKKTFNEECEEFLKKYNFKRFRG